MSLQWRVPEILSGRVPAMSLRGRVLLALLVVVTGGLLVSDLATYQALRTFLVEKVDAQINALHHPLQDRILRGEGGPGGPGGAGGGASFAGTTVYTQVRDAKGTVVFSYSGGPFGETPKYTPGIPARVPTPPTCGDLQCTQSVAFEVPSAQPGGPSYRVHAYALPGAVGQLLIALPLNDVSDTLRQLLIIEGLVTLAVLVGGTAMGLYLVRVGLRPLSEIEDTAEAIAAGDLSQRIKRAEPRTEVGRLGIALNAMLHQIETAFAEKDASESRLRRFLADASHELRTPLTSIRGYAELFRRGASKRPDDLAKVMSRIEEEGKRMGILVDDLLLLARLDQGRPLDRKPVDLAVVAADAVDAARAVEPDRRIDLGGPASVIVTGESTRLRQVIDNLLANVRTHTPAGTPAHVSLAVEDDQAVLEVADEGPGLPSRERELIFDRFHRSDPSRSRDSGGAGLGLAIVDAIVAAHGGTLVALDNTPTGAVFRAQFPLRRYRPDAPEAAEPAQESLTSL
jgi:two-component system OmpR family sensor kinase